MSKAQRVSDEELAALLRYYKKAGWSATRTYYALVSQNVAMSERRLRRVWDTLSMKSL